jgi:hypothetical protein
LFDPETDEPSLKGLWEELVGFENTGSGSIPKNGDGDEKDNREGSKSKEAKEKDRSTRITADTQKYKEQQAGMRKEKGMILLVGFSELIYQGFSPEYLARFGRALLGWCRQVSPSSSLLAAACYQFRGLTSSNTDLSYLIHHATSCPVTPIQTQTSLITTLHTPLLLNGSSLGDHLSVSPTSDPESDLLLRLLRAGQDGGIWWRVEELKSGRSGVVHGEVSLSKYMPESWRR